MSCPSSPETLPAVLLENEQPRRTLSGPVSVEGTGIHSGAPCKVAMSPAEPGSGIRFTRGGEIVSATIDLADAEKSDRRTVVVGPGGERFEQIEHLMAALSAHGITDVLVEQTGPEVPFLDGGSRDYMAALGRAGVREIAGARPVLEIRDAVSFEDGDAWFAATPHDGLRLSCFVEFPGTVVGNAGFSLEISAESFAQEAAAARTFALASDIEKLRAAGLIRGGNLENAVVFDHERYHNPQLNYPDEVVRHKIIDFLGDLALLPYGLRGHFWAWRAGHRSHVRFAQFLMETVRNRS